MQNNINYAYSKQNDMVKPKIRFEKNVVKIVVEKYGNLY